MLPSLKRRQPAAKYAITVGAYGDGPMPGLGEDYRATVEAWRAARLERLRQPYGWLSLVGLHWLTDGVNRVGSDPANEVVLTSGPPLAGRLVLEGGEVRTWSEPGGLMVDGGLADGIHVASDEEADAAGGEPTGLDLGSLHMIVIRRSGRLALRVWDANAPLRRTFRGIDAFPIDALWRIEARFSPADSGTTIEVPGVVGPPTAEQLAGRVSFAVDGVEVRLAALEGGEPGELWLIFGDATNGRETYGGGRFLYTDPPSADGQVVVDFNLAYNPPCVFTPYATCPLPPAGNRLEVRIEAGEKVWSPSG
jgi:uncharacterized protein